MYQQVLTYIKYLDIVGLGRDPHNMLNKIEIKNMEKIEFFRRWIIMIHKVPEHSWVLYVYKLKKICKSYLTPFLLFSWSVIDLFPNVGGEVSGGYRALLRFELPACYHQNFGIFWGVWLFQKNCCLKIYPTPVKSLFENTMGNPFFTFIIWTETLHKTDLKK